ncbi:unnamed protein product [Lactuca saligna]|uniref:Ubiquitin-like protease family profile domain-containing protein n=1 Tax=Lactuca saligna TaxID=75948 RepID=A0AA36E9J7_LACSI|nr:unnamed protein product [Lactuca saligna]
MTTSRINAVVKVLLASQKKAVYDMGFSSLLKLDVDVVPWLLKYYLLDVYDSESNRLVMENGMIEITKELVHKMMDLPMEGDDLSRMPYCETGNEILEEWKAQYVDKKFQGEAYVKHIRSTEEDNMIFKLNFLILFINTFIESMVGAYKLERICGEGMTKQATTRDLLLCYWYENIKLEKRIPFISHVKGDKLIQIQEMEIKLGGFGRQFRDSYLNYERMGCEEEEEESELYGDIDPFVAVLEHSYGKLLSKKSNMEVALKHGLQKFPESKVLKEWIIKKNELFNENDYVKENYNENDIPYHGKELVEYQGDLSPIRGLVRKRKDIDEGCSYVEPRMENELTHDDLTMTQFYKLPGVMDEMIDMASKTEMMFSSSKRVEEEENPIVMVGFNSNEGRNLEEELNNVANEDDNGKRGKGDKKSTNLFHSPFIELVIRVDVKLKNEDIDRRTSIFTSKRNNGLVDPIWDIGVGEVFHQGFVYHFKRDVYIHSRIIDCWAAFLNKMEEYRDKGSIVRLFLDTKFLTSEILNKSDVGVETCRLFDGLLRVYTNKFKVFIPVVDVDMYYVVCFDLRTGKCFIIDHVNRKGSVDIETVVQLLISKNHSKVKALIGAEPHVMNIRWHVAKLGPNCGLYLMRHMESYMGEGEGRWDSGFIGKGNADTVALMNLRTMYLARIMKSEFNVHKKC